MSTLFAEIIPAERTAVPGASGFVCSLCWGSLHPAFKFCPVCGAELVNGGSYGT